MGCLAWALLYCCCPKFACCLRTAVRTELRQKAGIEGRPIDDCWISCFLPACALCQEEHEFEQIQPMLAQQQYGMPGAVTVQAAVVPISTVATAVVVQPVGELNESLVYSK